MALTPAELAEIAKAANPNANDAQVRTMVAKVARPSTPPTSAARSPRSASKQPASVAAPPVAAPPAWLPDPRAGVGPLPVGTPAQEPQAGRALARLASEATQPVESARWAQDRAMAKLPAVTVRDPLVDGLAIGRPAAAPAPAPDAARVQQALDTSRRAWLKGIVEPADHAAVDALAGADLERTVTDIARQLGRTDG